MRYIFEKLLLPNCAFPVSLSIAVRSNQNSILLYYLSQNIDVNTEYENTGFQGQTPLVAAILQNDILPGTNVADL